MLTVIASSPDRMMWASDCLQSLGRDALIVTYGDYELGKIGWVLRHTTADRFLFLQDSFMVKSQRFWSMLDEHAGSVSLLSDPDVFGCYAGVYERHVLERVGVPVVESKREAVRGERQWTRAYCAQVGHVPVLFPDVSDDKASGVVERHGRQNLVLENDVIVKYKGTWKDEQL